MIISLNYITKMSRISNITKIRNKSYTNILSARGENLVIYVSLLGKNVLLTPHSFERMVERDITIDEVKSLLESKESQAIFQKNGNIRITNGYISAILRLSGSILYLVTVYKD